MKASLKYLATFALAALIVGNAWYFFLYPQEPWIKYNFAVRADEIDAFADYLEGQSEFQEFSCIADDVWLDKKAAPQEIHKQVQDHCRTTRIVRGEKTDTGSFYYLGWDTRWFNDYWIAVVRGTDLDKAQPCSRWRKPKALEECVVRLSELWAIHYFNVTDIGEGARDLAEDVMRQSATQ